MERTNPAPLPATSAPVTQPRVASSARLRLAALHGPAEPTAPLPGIPLSEAITAHHRAARPAWLTALADRVPPTLRGRWLLDARAAVALACVAMLGALVGSWYLWQAQPTVVDLPGESAPASSEPGRHAERFSAAARSFSGPVSESSDSTNSEPHSPDPAPLLVAGSLPTSLTTRAPGSTGDVIVDVEGKVARPGIETLARGSRVYDALRSAGGTTPGVDLTALDLARPLVDGEQLRIGLPVPIIPPGTGDGPVAAAGARSKRAKPAQPVNLNAATAEQLETVPDIGPAMAQRILDWRVQHGQFASVAQLRQVRGIGDHKFADIKDSVTV